MSLVNDPFLDVQLDAREFGISFCIALKAIKTLTFPFLVAREQLSSLVGMAGPSLPVFTSLFLGRNSKISSS